MRNDFDIMEHMFNSVSGILTAKFHHTVYIETGGIEWEILVPDSALDALPAVGENARIYTWLYHREDQMTLFGFASPDDRFLFLDLLKVDGVGAKAALKILSSVSPEQLRAAIDNEELSRLEAVSGIGKKTAQKMLLALKGKLTFPEKEREKNTGEINPWKDIVVALSDMGYDRREAETAVARIVSDISAGAVQSPSAAEFGAMSREAKEEILFRRAITELAR
jgi:Holliday junction DNA helicase RuvA